MRAPVQLEEGCGVEDAVDLQRRRRQRWYKACHGRELPPKLSCAVAFRYVMQRPCFRGSKHFSYFYDIYFSKEFSPNKQSCLKISCVLRFQARPHPGWREKGSVPYHVPRPSPVALHCSLVDGPGFETRCCRSCPTGHDVYKGQRTVTQLRLSPSRNFIGRLSCQIGH